MITINRLFSPSLHEISKVTVCHLNGSYRSSTCETQITHSFLFYLCISTHTLLDTEVHQSSRETFCACTSPLFFSEYHNVDIINKKNPVLVSNGLMKIWRMSVLYLGPLEQVTLIYYGSDPNIINNILNIY